MIKLWALALSAKDDTMISSGAAMCSAETHTEAQMIATAQCLIFFPPSKGWFGHQSKVTHAADVDGNNVTFYSETSLPPEDKLKQQQYQEALRAAR